MRLKTWWHWLMALNCLSLAWSTPTVCEEEACYCDAFTRVICNCTHTYDDVTLRPDGAYGVPPMTTAIIIDGCNRAQFLPDTVRNLIFLRAIELRNVGNVVINERAMAWLPSNSDAENTPGIKIVIHNSTINEISSHAIQGRIDRIQISSSRINLIKAFAFSSLTSVAQIELTDNKYDNIQTQAFKKFTVTNFILRGGEVDALPSRFLSDVEVTEVFRMDSVTVKYVYSLAFLISSPTRVLIENNVIGALEGDGFKIATRGPITFRNNTVKMMRKGAFHGFTVQASSLSVMGRQELLIENSTVTDLTQAALEIDRNSITMRLDGLRLNRSCSCQLADEWHNVLKEQGSAIYCWYNLEQYYVSMPTFIDARCGRIKQLFWIFVVVGVLVILLVVAVILYYVLKRENDRKKKVQIVMPDGKTYKETELHIVVERAELLTTDF